MLQSPPMASHIPLAHGTFSFVNAVPSALHVTSVLPMQDFLLESQTAVVQRPSISLQSPAVSHSSTRVKPIPSGEQTCNETPEHLCWFGMHDAQVLLGSPAMQSAAVMQV